MPRTPVRSAVALGAGLALSTVALGAPALCAPAPTARQPLDLALVDRVTWGATAADVAAVRAMGADRWLARQLHPPADDALPPAAQAQIDALPVSTRPAAALVVEAQARNETLKAITDPDQKKAAQQAYQQGLSELAREAATRSLLRDLYSPDQLKEQMTWFWLNHFNVHAQKAEVRAVIGEYEDQTIRPHALGRFRDLLEATLKSPAMLRYLDNAQNAAGKVNENYAREIMELHTLGVGSGYTQKDVTELARILTGVGVDTKSDPPRVRPALQGQLIREGLFEFSPNRHDYGDKVLLGHTVKGRGFAEVEEALDILSREPATARHVSRQLAVYFVSDSPPDALVDRMAATFRRSDGDIAAVLQTLFRSPEFKASLATGRFKDPVHYVVSAVRLAYGDRVVLNTQPMQGWLKRLGEGLYDHETPDGFPLESASWNAPGQMSARFEVARQVGGGAYGLFKTDGPSPVERPAFPQLQNALYYEARADALAPATRAALAQATSPQDWNTLFLSSPEFMRR